MEKQRVVHTPEGGVCSKMMIVEAENNTITDVQVVGGCDGNLQGLSKLLIGMPVHEAINRMDGINCRQRGSSCPDQLAQALKK
ncbi:MAG: TIGR03905 family TSCPD domain-containing protein [Tannerellaceae bacterium]|nr:TIGR03905 family TSCPD domain-containing protein [Tannerellaceae bacterium]